MKWIGQHIYDLISRFRDDVYLEDLSEATQDHVVSVDADGKLYKQDVATGDITAVTITTDSGGGSAASDTGGSADFSILGGEGVNVTNSGTTITAVAVPGEIDHDSLNNFAANEHFTQANITTVGTIGTGVWQGDAIASAYLDSDTAHLSVNQTFSGTKTFGRGLIVDGDLSVTPGDGAAIHVDASDITDTATSGAGTATAYRHVSIENPRLLAANPSVTTSDAATLYIKGAPAAHTNQTITRSWALWVGGAGARFDGSIYSGTTEAINSSGLLTVANQTGITGVGTLVSGNATAIVSAASDTVAGKVELATTAEAITGTDTARAVTPAGLKARVSQIINLKGYTTNLQDGVYEYANPYNTDDEAPFQMQTSYGSGTIGSGTEVNQKTFFRSGGFHVPFACTVSTIQVQATINGATSTGGNIVVAIAEYRPSDAGGDQNDYPREVYEEVTVLASDNANKVKSTTIATGDLDATAIPAGSHLILMIKGDSDTASATAIVSASIGLSW